MPGVQPRDDDPAIPGAADGPLTAAEERRLNELLDALVDLVAEAMAEEHHREAEKEAVHL